ncbi:MAG: glycosyltransferase family 2 protein [Abditibacteriota bacterium]|nr:glycosyltransferase family 2 protein [Abditibacteriota bacterium]
MFFSIIVPVYGIEPYVGKCLESITAQTFDDFEAIIVDDGSPDGCGAICDEYAQKDGRLTVIHKPNGGLVSARKAGLAVAKGRYIVNLDGDDWLVPEALQKLYDAACKNGMPDILSFGLLATDNSEYENEPAEEGYYDRERIKEVIFPRLILDKRGGRVLHYLCGKAIKRELQEAVQFQIPEGVSFGEDTCTTTPIYFMARSLFISYDRLYMYLKRTDSESTLFKVKRYSELEHALVHLDGLDSSEGPADFREQVDRYAMMSSFIFLIMYMNNGKPGCLPEISRHLKGDILRPHLARARFEGFSLKTRIIMNLIKHGNAAGAYYLYKTGEDIKRFLKGGKK